MIFFVFLHLSIQGGGPPLGSHTWPESSITPPRHLWHWHTIGHMLGPIEDMHLSIRCQIKTNKV